MKLRTQDAIRHWVGTRTWETSHTYRDKGGQLEKQKGNSDSDSASEAHGRGPPKAGATRAGAGTELGACVDKQTRPGSERGGGVQSACGGQGDGHM